MKEFDEVSRISFSPDSAKLLRIARVVYVLIFIGFCVVYWSFVLTNKSKLEKKGLLFEEEMNELSMIKDSA